MDEEGPDAVLPIPNGKILKENLVGSHMDRYDSMLVLAHFKGHPMGGYGGALKQLSIGCASRAGKALIHSGGKTDSNLDTWDQHADSTAFPEAMADAASSVIDRFAGKLVCINVMKNLTVDCDCCSVAEEPCMQDIGMLALHRPGGAGSGVHRSDRQLHRPGPGSFYGAGQQPQRHPHHRGGRRPGRRRPGV